MATNCIAVLVAKYRIAGMTSWGRGTPKEGVFLKACPLALIREMYIFRLDELEVQYV